MTKEELYNCIVPLKATGLISIGSVKNLLDKFFDSNVCIPKGDNCHPYHMELHQWAENPLVDLQVFNDTKGEFTLSIFDEYQIKPQEPVYEWQWLVKVTQPNSLVTAYVYDHLTIEKSIFHKSYNEEWTKIEETKRVRKGL